MATVWGCLTSTKPFVISVGTYSVIGAASFISGVMRMTISHHHHEVMFL